MAPQGPACWLSTWVWLPRVWFTDYSCWDWHPCVWLADNSLARWLQLLDSTVSRRSPVTSNYCTPPFQCWGLWSPITDHTMSTIPLVRSVANLPTMATPPFIAMCSLYSCISTELLGQECCNQSRSYLDVLLAFGDKMFQHLISRS